jgi:hypothetical protein
LNPLVIEFRGLDRTARETHRTEIPSAVKDLTGLRTKLQILQASEKVPACARAGLATAINGADLLITGVSDFGGMSCVYAAGGPNCDAQDAAASKEWDAGLAMFESGVSSVQTACGIAGD